MKSNEVTSALEEYGEIKSLAKRAFPKNEQYPFWLLRLLAVRKDVDFLAWYEDGQFCGISYTISDSNCVFVLYLAVNDAVRSRGYGSKILAGLKERYCGENVFLNVEMPDPKAVNAVQRERRLAFYERNGYHRTDSWIVDGGERYLILSLDESYDLKAYARLLRRFSFGLYRPVIRS